METNELIDELISELTDENTLTIYNVTPETVHKIVIPQGIENLCIKGDYLDHFNIPKGIIDVTIDFLGLKTIYIPDGVKYVKCQRNFLRIIEIPPSLVGLIAHHNLLTNVTFRSSPNKLNHLDIRSNRITNLDFDLPKKLQTLNASFNKIEYAAPGITTFLKSMDNSHFFLPETSDDEDWYQHLI